MADDFKYDVFLSHSAKDQAAVHPSAERLRVDGLRVWFDEGEIRLGDSIPAKIEEGLEHSCVLVLCRSVNAFASDGTQLEAGTLRFRDPLNKDRRFVPRRGYSQAIIGAAALFLCAAVSWAAEEQQPTVTVKAEYKVEKGKLQVEHLPDQTADDALAKLYGKKSLAQAFKKHVLEEVNASLETLNPIAEWKAPLDGGRTKIDVTNLISVENLPASKSFSGPLRGWLTQFLVEPGNAGTFFQWYPTRPPTVEEGSEKQIVEQEISVVLSSTAASLIAKMDQREVAETDYRTGTLKLKFDKALPVKRVNIVGMDLPEQLSAKLTPSEKATFGEYQRQKEQFESELSVAATGLALAWNDDLAVQRMMIVLRARGMWNGFAQADKGSPRAVHWLTLHTNSKAEVEADVHLPHLCYIRFEPGATDNRVVLAVTKELLSPDECNVIQDSINIQGSTADEDQFLKNIVSPISKAFGGGRFVDLYSLASYRGFRRTGCSGVRFPPFPVKESWLASRLDRIRDMGWYVSAEPTLKGENRLRDSGSAKRKANLNGGIDIRISPPGDPNKASPAATNGPSFKDWLLDTVKYRVEAGAGVQDTQPVDWFTRLSATHTETFGSLATEFRYQSRLSAKLDWQPPNSEDTLLPSHVSAFTDSAARREVDGQDIEIERTGFRIGKRKSFDSPDLERRVDAAIELAHVRDVADFVPDADEFCAPWAFSLFSESNLWDTREYWSVRASATPAVRWRSDTDFWCLAGASGQIRRPYGLWDYFGSFDVRWAAGAAPPDALPYVGGVDGVRGVRPYGVPARARLVVRNELWVQVPFRGRSVGRDQHWYGLAYETLRLAGFVDVGWASGIRERDPTDPWFVSPGAGVRLILMPRTHLNLDYAYGLCRPSSLGGHRFSLGLLSPAKVKTLSR
jgi:hypothetical protein